MFTKEEKMNKYNAELIVYILLIAATDLTKYDEGVVICFAEAIEGEVDYLFTDEIINKTDNFLKVDNTTKNNIFKLKELFIKMYSSQWHKKLQSNSPERIEIMNLAKKIILELNITYELPEVYNESHLEIDW